MLTRSLEWNFNPIRYTGNKFLDEYKNRAGGVHPSRSRLHELGQISGSIIIYIYKHYFISTMIYI